MDTSLQNAQYHLEKLEDAGAIEVVDTAYSAKGREMDVYAPADQPLVIFAGDEEKGSTLKAALSRLLGAVGLLAVASVLVQQLFGPGGPFGSERRAPASGAAPANDSGSDVGTPTPESDDVPQMGEEAATPTNETVPTDLEVPTDSADSANVTPTEPAETASNLTDTTPTETLDPETATVTADAAREASAGLPPGLVFFAGGLFALALIAAVYYLRA